MMILLLAGLAATASGQVRITSTERLPLPAEQGVECTAILTGWMHRSF